MDNELMRRGGRTFLFYLAPDTKILTYFLFQKCPVIPEKNTQQCSPKYIKKLQTFVF